MAAKEKKKEETFVEAANRLIKDMPDLVSDPRIGRRVSPVTGAPSPRLGKAEPNALLEEYASGRSPDLVEGRAIDPRRSPVTGAPSPRLGKAEPNAPKTGKVMVGDMTLEALFTKTHGGSFDPKSAVDRKKMSAITNLMTQEGIASMTPNQFALAIYRTTK